VDEGVGLARAVEFAAAGFVETEFGVEGAGLGIGLVDLERNFDARRKGVADQSAADALTKRTGVDEQRIELISSSAKESDGLIAVIGGDPEAGLREVFVADEAGKELEIVGCEEMVGSLDGGEPDFVQAAEV